MKDDGYCTGFYCAMWDASKCGPENAKAFTRQHWGFWKLTSFQRFPSYRFDEMESVVSDTEEVFCLGDRMREM